MNNWHDITEIPKHKNRKILLVQWSNNIPIQEYIAESYADALHFRTIQMKHSFTHWCYITPPKT